MEVESINDIARSSAPIDYDKARHPLTIADAVELFAQLGTPRSKRSVQRFCEQGHLDRVRIKGPRGDQFFISRESVERYAGELRQIEAISRATHSRPRRLHQEHATSSIVILPAKSLSVTVVGSQEGTPPSVTLYDPPNPPGRVSQYGTVHCGLSLVATLRASRRSLPEQKPALATANPWNGIPM